MAKSVISLPSTNLCLSRPLSSIRFRIESLGRVWTILRCLAVLIRTLSRTRTLLGNSTPPGRLSKAQLHRLAVVLVGFVCSPLSSSPNSSFGCSAYERDCASGPVERSRIVYHARLGNGRREARTANARTWTIMLRDVVFNRNNC